MARMAWMRSDFVWSRATRRRRSRRETPRCGSTAGSTRRRTGVDAGRDRGDARSLHGATSRRRSSRAFTTCCAAARTGRGAWELRRAPLCRAAPCRWAWSPLTAVHAAGATGVTGTKTQARSFMGLRTSYSQRRVSDDPVHSGPARPHACTSPTAGLPQCLPGGRVGSRKRGERPRHASDDQF